MRTKKDPEMPHATEHAEQAALIDWIQLVRRLAPYPAAFVCIPNGAALPKRWGTGGGSFPPGCEIESRRTSPGNSGSMPSYFTAWVPCAVYRNEGHGGGSIPTG